MTAVTRWGVVYLVGALCVGWALWDRALLALLLVGSIVCALAAWRMHRLNPGVKAVLLVAFAARVLVFPAPPSLSDDGYRYLWDGYAQVSGVSPYAFTPEQAEDLGPQVLLDRMNSGRFYSVYPPVTQAAFALAANWSGDWLVAWYAWKLICLVAEATAAALLIRLAGSRGALIYLLHPLSWIEAVGQAHSEALLVPAILAAVWLAQHRRLRDLAGLAIAVAALVKLYPIVLMPLFARTWRAWILAGVGTLAMSAAYLSAEAVRNGLESVRLFGVYFEFNGGPYIVFKAALWKWAPLLAPHASRLLLCIFVPAALAVGYRLRARPIAATLAIVAVYLGCSATVHPWYALILLALAALIRPIPFWVLAWGLLSLSTYSRYVWGDEIYLWSVGLTWCGAQVTAVLCAALRRRRLKYPQLPDSQ